MVGLPGTVRDIPTASPFLLTPRRSGQRLLQNDYTRPLLFPHDGTHMEDRRA
jgi:hypothetical protein